MFPRARVALAAFVLTLSGMTGVLMNPPVAQAATGSGYLMVSADGKVYKFGSAPFCGHSDMVYSRRATDVEITPNGKGYWILIDGGFVDFKRCDMSTDDYLAYETNNIVSLNSGEKAVSMSVLPDGTGYWVFTDRGRTIPFGNAQFFGDMSSTPLNGAILGSVATPDGKGYWMVGSDGGIFSFGNAKFSGSTGNLKLNKPVMSMAPDPDGAGYWLVASDGGIFAFDAPFKGSMGGTPLNKPVTGMVPGSNGYLMVAQDGGIFSFGDVTFHGSLGATPSSSPILAVSLFSGDPSFKVAQPVTPPPPPAPEPVYEVQTIFEDAGIADKHTAMFELTDATGTMTVGCGAYGASYNAGCIFVLRTAGGSQVDYISLDDNREGSIYIHPDAGVHYIEVSTYSVDDDATWAVIIEQPRCVQHCG